VSLAFSLSRTQVFFQLSFDDLLLSDRDGHQPMLSLSMSDVICACWRCSKEEKNK
jgi:hypothetical protein